MQAACMAPDTPPPAPAVRPHLPPPPFRAPTPSIWTSWWWTRRPSTWATCQRPATRPLQPLPWWWPSSRRLQPPPRQRLNITCPPPPRANIWPRPLRTTGKKNISNSISSSSSIIYSSSSSASNSTSSIINTLDSWQQRLLPQEPWCAGQFTSISCPCSLCSSIIYSSSRNSSISTTWDSWHQQLLPQELWCAGLFTSISCPCSFKRQNGF